MPPDAQYCVGMEWNVETATLKVAIRTEGALAFLGHDRSFTVPVTVRLSGGPDEVSVDLEGNLTKVELEGDVSEKDRKEILARTHKDVLETRRYPTCRFTGILRLAESTLRGRLQLHGRETALDLPVRLGEQAGARTGEGEIELDLQAFGIKPFKALLGQLRVKSDVQVGYRVVARPA